MCTVQQYKEMYSTLTLIVEVIHSGAIDPILLVVISLHRTRGRG